MTVSVPSSANYRLTPCLTKRARQHWPTSVGAALLMCSSFVGASEPNESPKEGAPPPSASEGVELDKVLIVKKLGDLDRRRFDATNKITLGRPDIERFGDTKLSDVLNRVAGLSVSGGSLRMRGLGEGYVQILVDGSPTPTDFSVDSIAPDAIERIEILPTATAEFSGRSIAGTINIVLKRATQKPAATVKLGVSNSGNGTTPSVGVLKAGASGSLTYSIVANAGKERSSSSNLIVDQAEDGTGNQTSSRSTVERYSVTTTYVNIAPQLTWKLDGADKITWSALAESRAVDWVRRRRETDIVGGPTDYPINDWLSDSNTVTARTDATWSHPTQSGAQLDVKIGANYQKRSTSFRFLGFDDQGSLLLNRDVPSRATDTSLTSTGKYKTSIGQDHQVDAGWDGTLTRRTERRQQYDYGPSGSLSDTLDESYSADIRRLAFYVQDVWQVQERLSAYIGVRWEGLSTHVSGRTIDSVATDSGVVSPVAQLLWQVPGSEKDQVRVSLARTYSAPTPQNLVPRRYTANNGNGPTNPDFQGNAGLRPEIAWGLDGAYEHYVGRNGLVSLSLYARSIKDVVVRSLFEENGVWITTPTNAGSARAAGATFEVKIPVRELLSDDAPRIDLRASATRNWSKVSAVPAPNNRLPEQVPLTANIGLDYTLTDAFSMGVDLAYSARVRWQAANNWLRERSANRTLDTYALWKLSPGVRLRVSARNVLHPNDVDGSFYSDANGSVSRVYEVQTKINAKATLEIDF